MGLLSPREICATFKGGEGVGLRVKRNDTVDSPHPRGLSGMSLSSEWKSGINTLGN